MKPIILALVATCLNSFALGQCGACTIGDTCMVSPPYPTICPPVAPVGIVGVPYELDVTFWIPPTFQDNTTSLNVVLQELTLLNLERVPLGLTFEASSPTLTYYPQISPYGCVRVCGVPVQANTDSILVIGQAQGTAGGLPINQVVTLRLPIVILPASADTVPDFFFAPDSLCAPMTISLSEAQGAPGMTTSFSWSFGNGNAFNGAAPPDQAYLVGGSHPITLQRSFSVPTMTQLAVTEVSNSWCGDLDEPNLPLIGCVGQPDLYFTLTDSRLAIWRSTIVNNAQSTTWNNLSIPLGFPPFTLRIYDKDDLSADDLLGTFPITEAEGGAGFSQNGTTGSRQVQVQTVLSISYTDTAVVYPLPEVTLEADFENGLMCASPSNLAWYEWTLDGVPLQGVNSSCAPLANGAWVVTATSAEGCVGDASQTVNGVGIRESSMAGNGLNLEAWLGAEGLLVRLGQSTSGGRLQLFDASTRLVLAHDFASGTVMPFSVPVPSLANGCYVLRAEQGGLDAVRRIVVGRP